MSECQKLGREVRLSVAVDRYELVNDELSSDSNQLNRALGAIKARVSLIPTSSGQHVEYPLRVTCDGKTWKMQKRFAEISALHEVLVRRLNCLPAMPAKSVVRQFDHEHLEGRRAGLAAYFEALCKRRDVLNSNEVQEFFGMTQNLPAYRQPHASEPSQAAEVQESAFGITDFSYNPIQGLLLLGATDCSWTSRMDTKITNIKLPWEPTAPNLPTSQMSLWRQSPADLRFEMLFTVRFCASISSVVLTVGSEKGYCLCGLGDGTVGCHSTKGESGMNNMGNTLPLLRHTAGVVAIAYDECDQWVVSASKDNGMIVYDMRRQTILSEAQTSSPCTSMHYCEAQKRLFTGLQSGKVIVWDMSSFPIREVTRIPDGSELSNSRISGLDYDSATSVLFMANKDGFSLWNVRISNQSSWGRCVGQILNLSHTPTAVAWSNSSREIIAGFSNGTVIIFDVDRGDASYALQAHRDEVTSMMWLDAPRRLITASKDKTMKIWDFPSLLRISLEDQVAHVSVEDFLPRTSQSTSQPSSQGGRKSAKQGAAFDPRDPLGGLAKKSESQTSGGYTGETEERQSAPTSFSSLTSSTLDPLGSAVLGSPKVRRSSEDSSSPKQASFTGRQSAFNPSDPLGALSRPAAKKHVGGLKKDDSDDDLLRWDS